MVFTSNFEISDREQNAMMMKDLNSYQRRGIVINVSGSRVVIFTTVVERQQAN